MDLTQKHFLQSMRIIGWCGAVLTASALLVGALLGLPHYRVWQLEKRGQAAVAEAEYSKKTLIYEAMAQRCAAVEFALADSIRAEALALTIEIVGTRLMHFPDYLRHRWIEGLHDGSSEIIYVPTEGNLPMLEAMRLRARSDGD